MREVSAKAQAAAMARAVRLGQSTHYCSSCRRDMQECTCPTTLAWSERAWARRERMGA